MFQDYEFLDLSDVKEAELNRLQCALYERIPDISATALAGGWNEPNIGNNNNTKNYPSKYLTLKVV